MNFIGSVISKKVLNEKNETMEIDYSVTRGESLTDGAKGAPVYGIYVKLSIDGKCRESSKVEDVSPSEETVERLVQLFAKNLVTPVSLKDVVEDCLAVTV